MTHTHGGWWSQYYDGRERWPLFLYRRPSYTYGFASLTEFYAIMTLTRKVLVVLYDQRQGLVLHVFYAIITMQSGVTASVLITLKHYLMVVSAVRVCPKYPCWCFVVVPGFARPTFNYYFLVLALYILVHWDVTSPWRSDGYNPHCLSKIPEIWWIWISSMESNWRNESWRHGDVCDVD